jgi:hypothetical protein
MRKPLSGRNGYYTIKEKSEEFLYSRLSSGKEKTLLVNEEIP